VCWVFPFQNPIIKAGDLYHRGLWNDPSVLKENGLYIMYMTTSIQEAVQAADRSIQGGVAGWSALEIGSGCTGSDADRYTFRQY